MTVPHNALLDLDEGVGQVSYMIRYYVLSPLMDRIGTIKPHTPTSIDVNTDSGAKRTLRGFSLPKVELDQFDLFRDRLQPTFVLEDGTEWPMGVFYFVNDAVYESTWSPIQAVDLLDGDAYYLDDAFLATFSVPQGGSIVQAVTDICDQAQIQFRTIPDNAINIGDTMVFNRKTPRRQALDQLCLRAGWLTPYFDNNGTLIIRPLPNLDDAEPDHIYTLDDRRIVHATPITRNNRYSAPNAHAVTCNGPTAGEISAIAYVDPNLPWSRENIGKVKCQWHDMQGIASTAHAQQIADRFAQTDPETFLAVEYSSTPDPRHDIFDVTRWRDQNMRELSWSLPLDPGKSVEMKHALTRGGFLQQ